MKRRDFLRLALSAMVILPISGCFGKEEVENLGFVLAIGIDQGKTQGTYRVTYQMGVPKKAGEGGGDIANLTYCAEGYSMRETLDEVYSMTAKKPFVGTVKTLLIGEDVAKEGINRVLDFFQRYYQFRRTTYLVISNGRADDTLKVKSRDDRLPAFIVQAIIERSKSTSTFPLVRLGHYLTVLATESTEPVIPVIEKTKPTDEEDGTSSDQEKTEELKISSAAAFSGDRLEEFLNETETRGYMWLTNNVEERSITATGQDGEGVLVSGRVVKSTTDWKLQPQNESYSFIYSIKNVVFLDEFHGEQKQRNPEEWLEEAENEAIPAFQQQIYKECQAICQKSKELGLDLLGVGRHIEEKKPAYWKTIKDQWSENYRNFPVQIEVEVKKGNSGSSTNPPTNPPGTRQE